MKRSIFFGSFLATALVCMGSVNIYAQDKPAAAAAANENPCQELTAEQIKKLTDENKKKYEEDLAKCKEQLAAYNKSKNVNETTTRALKEGNDAFTAKNYDVAIAKYDEGYNADPNYVGSAPVFLNNKAQALINRGYDKYKASATSNSAADKEAAKKDFTDAYEAANKSFQLTKSATPDPAQTAGVDKNKYDALTKATEALRLLTLSGMDKTKGAEILASYQEYMTVETDPAKKTKAHAAMADLLREAGDCENAATEYKKILAEKPDDADALAGAGLCLFNNGVSTDNKALMQEGMNTLSRFVEVAPENHKLKQSVRDAIDYLKNEQKIAPQKTARPAAAKKRGN